MGLHGQFMPKGNLILPLWHHAFLTMENIKQEHYSTTKHWDAHTRHGHRHIEVWNGTVARSQTSMQHHVTSMQLVLWFLRRLHAEPSSFVNYDDFKPLATGRSHMTFLLSNKGAGTRAAMLAVKWVLDYSGYAWKPPGRAKHIILKNKGKTCLSGTPCCSQRVAPCAFCATRRRGDAARQDGWQYATDFYKKPNRWKETWKKTW